MNHRSRLITTTVVNALLLLILPAAALADPIFHVAYDSFTDDVDHNGFIDCGELVRFRVSLADSIPSTTVSGSIVIPSEPAQGWFFRRGTVEIDNIFTVRCGPTIVHGNSPGDTFAPGFSPCVFLATGTKMVHGSWRQGKGQFACRS